jgi:hypothetical protein
MTEVIMKLTGMRCNLTEIISIAQGSFESRA